MDQITQILLSALGIIITGLATLAVAKFTEWINTKIKDEAAAKYLATIMEISMNAVKEVYQTFAETLKKEGKFDKEAQDKAIEMCLAKIKTQLAPEIIDYIKTNFGDITEYLKTLIESNIYSLKNLK